MAQQAPDLMAHGAISEPSATPLVSVVVPTFNRKAWLREAIDSVLNQQHAPSIEIIVVDDGSTDGTAEAMSDLSSQPIVRYFSQKNTGKPSIARNRGLREAKGEFIAFLDSDDLLHPESISRRLEILKAFEDVGLVSTDWRCFSGSLDLGTRPSIISAKGFLEKVPADMIDLRADKLFVFGKSFVYELLQSDCMNTSSVMLRRKVLDIAGPFDESITIGEDYDLWLRLGALARIAFLDEPLAFMRTHTSHITDDERRNFEDDRRVIERFLRRSGPVPAGLRRRVSDRLAQFYAAGGAVFLRDRDNSRALQFFLNSLRHNPYSWKTVKSVVKCLV
jgi:glycosyltransferase involved in cell wall biosynthesis